MPRINNVVLVHGGFVDGSGWAGVYDLLKRDGFNVSIVQNPTISLAGDVAATTMILDAQDGPAVLVGHSYGGVVITEAGTHSNVSALVYITAFAPDVGESVSSLIANPVPGYDPPPILPPQDGFLFLDKAKMPAAFAGDVDAGTAAMMADAQVPWGLEALGGAVTNPAWKGKPSWYLLVTDDRIDPSAGAALYGGTRWGYGGGSAGKSRDLRVQPRRGRRADQESGRAADLACRPRAAFRYLGSALLLRVKSPGRTAPTCGRSRSSKCDDPDLLYLRVRARDSRLRSRRGRPPPR